MTNHCQLSTAGRPPLFFRSVMHGKARSLSGKSRSWTATFLDSGRFGAIPTVPIPGQRTDSRRRKFVKNSMRTVYFDYNATTPLDPHVREAMLPYLGEIFG